jgi:hypothetical protein
MQWLAARPEHHIAVVSREGPLMALDGKVKGFRVPSEAGRLALRPPHASAPAVARAPPAQVTHSSFLHFTLSCFGEGAAETVQGTLHRWYENCEMRSIVLADEAATAPAELRASADDWHFPGGSKALGL